MKARTHLLYINKIIRGRESIRGAANEIELFVDIRKIG